MAERKLSWKTNGSILSVTEYGQDKWNDFNVIELFPSFDEMNGVQKHLVLFGVKQSMSDDTASIPDGDKKIEAINNTWHEFVMGKISEKRASSDTLKDKLTAEEKKLALYSAMTDEQKLLVAGLVSRATIEKEIKRLQKAIEKKESSIE